MSEALRGGEDHAASWYEASARERVAGLLDAASFVEFVPPTQRETSPHLHLFDLPVAFDDGMIVGSGRLAGEIVFVAAQEGRFMGGTFGEIAGAKLVGLLRAARQENATAAVLLLLDSGGVRLQEANAGEIAVSETIRSILEAREAGVAVIALIGGRAGTFGGAGLIAACCSHVVVSEQARIGVTGPEVIETNQGVEEFDSRDRALVWRITGGRTRALLGVADRYVPDRIASFRQVAADLANQAPPFDLATLAAEQQRLEQRLRAYGACRDSTGIWSAMGIADPDRLADLSDDGFADLLASLGASHDAR
ncbi:biotin-independent malonate decarboxylase subunit beta [Lichenicoccus sp.]|uniref:biotin-independent malonate decarboxylase subunit beta n=1 Tax=Lichenicoccus sp. TaxID=2781899 RepID=UPI003D0CFA97